MSYAKDLLAAVMHCRGGDETGDKYRRGCDSNAAKVSGPCGIQRVESMDEQNLVQLRDLTTGLYVLYGYFSPYSNSHMTMTFDNTMVVVTQKTAGSHLLVFTGTNSKVNFLQIMVDSTAAAGYTYTRTDFVLYDMHSLIAKVGELADLTTDEKSSIVSAINEIGAKVDNLSK